MDVLIGERQLHAALAGLTCSPVNGGSTDNLSETTTVFECFVANEDVGGGRMRGYTYHATMNWTTGKYTYGYGEG